MRQAVLIEPKKIDFREAYRFIDANRETCMKVIVDLEARS